MSVRVQREDFDLGAEVTALRRGNAAVGAVASFIGTVRDASGGTAVSAMELEHYPGMTEKALAAIEEAARQRWPLLGVTIVHRVGPLQPQDQIVLVAVASAHRGEAFAACEFIMDYLKSEAPFWKKETTPEGARWVDARVTDEAALRRWGVASINASGDGVAGAGGDAAAEAP
ncbi:molybdopterin synthase catalytic subunit MoaE [Cupriavidus malaysiensis]|uniref:Molybdopterin synthase catalytic subunit n=1 Tax=Cupriavidus malaysiensis TaxID=367825 RepID=A0ABN4TQ82_9BURK|nr:molybdopterin synthase catalytic subunit MoaE [Cupriavidus malaysiensis]AOZ06856.1 molybdenum cofactor biosynthesis protein MoaE [Cupriavidus malaysiensis]